jgi:bifunctional UDP-N-acetylglucosamine pyrophosphorylase/glucosamine-1-phosphate N-acetyltransferase
MPGISAIIFVPDDTQKTGASLPTMLLPVMGCPLLRWLASSLSANGIRRVFLVCHARFAELAQSCFPATMQVTVSRTQDAPELLHVFLSTADELDEEVTVITGPVVCLRGETAASRTARSKASVYTVERQGFMEALDDKFDFMGFLRRGGQPLTETDGYYPVSGPDELTELASRLKRSRNLELLRRGVTIWDIDNCYVEPGVFVSPGAELRPGVILRGKTAIGEGCVIGPNSYIENAVIGAGTSVNASQIYDSTVGSNTTVGPFAYVRPGSKIGGHVKVGDFVEVKNSTIGDGTKISHLTYVGDTDMGRNCNLGCGTVTVNYDKVRKYRTTVEDNCFIGCNTNLVAPVTVGEGAYIAAGSTITDDVPANALGIARARQTNKKDWAAKNKVKK